MSTTNEVEIKNRKEKDSRKREKYLDSLKSLLNDVNGRRFIWEQLDRCGVYQSSADNSGSWTYFNEGKRSIGLILLADIMETDDEKYLVMMREQRKGV